MNWPLFERICNIPGIPGFEQGIGSVIATTMQGFCDDVRRDRLGNIIGVKKSRKTKSCRRVVLAAHMDEIGFIVKNIDKQGFLTVHPLGGLHAQILISQRVVIHGKKTIRGVIAPRFNEINERIPKISELRVDTGLTREELECIEIGDMVSLDTSVEKLNDKVYSGRNFDNRVGVYCLLESLRQADSMAVDVYAVGTVQEEVGIRGMWPAAYEIEPELALAIDGSLCSGPYGEDGNICELGKGTGIYLVDNLTIGDRRLIKFLFELAERKGISCQNNIGGGTDASALQRSRSGALVTTIGAPVRYMHSTVQICHDDDLNATVQLLVAFMESAHEFEY